MRSPNLTAAELGRILRLTRADIRYHLKPLLAQGVIIQVPSATAKGRSALGRPAKAYRLSPHTRPDILPMLADILLQIGISGSAPEQTAFLGEIASRLAGADHAESSPDNLTAQLNYAIQKINEYPYQARWEAHQNGPHIFFHNCPFAEIISRHPELCSVDRRMLEKLTGLQAIQTGKIDLSGSGPLMCTFRRVSSGPIGK
jgi:predicted ArsR family transcriptional regulator